MEAETILSVEHVGKSFGSHRVLTDVSLSVARGDVTCTIGPGGALTLSGDLEGTGTCASKIVDDRTLRLEVSMEDGSAFTGVCGVRDYDSGGSTPVLLLSNADYILSFLPAQPGGARPGISRTGRA